MNKAEGLLVCNPVPRRLLPILLGLGLGFWVLAGSGPVLAAPGSGRGSPVLFSRARGVFTNSFSLELSARQAGAIVRFTLDGSEPGIRSSVANGPMQITNSVQIRARAFDRDGGESQTVWQQFVRFDPDLAAFDSNLPLLVISTFGASFTEKQSIAGSLTVFTPDPGRSSLSSLAEFHGPILIRQRGRASMKYRKRSYALKTLTPSGAGADIPLLGMPKDSDWILYGPHPDKTLMRDVLAYELSNQLGRWAPRTRFVEVFLCQAGNPVTRKDYVGVYVVVEKIEPADHRVSIERLEPQHNSWPQLTGGYIFKKDHSDAAGFDESDAEGGPPFTASSFGNTTGYPTGPGAFPADPAGFLPPLAGRSTLTVSSSSSRSDRAFRTGPYTNVIGRTAPAPSLPSAFRMTQFDGDDGLGRSNEGGESSFFESFTTSVMTNRFYFVEPEKDEITAVQQNWLREHLDEVERMIQGPDFADPVKGYAMYLDVDSFVDYHLLVEVTKNVDGYRFSTFYHKDRDGRIRMGPLWDWNLSFGNCNAKQGYLAEYWLWPQLNDREYSWFRRLFEDPDFGQKYVDRWWTLRQSVLATSNLLGRVSELAASLDEAQKRNFERWPVLGITVKPNWYVGETYEDEIIWMKDWITRRLAWMDAQFVSPPVAMTVGSGRRVLRSDQKGAQILFTIDGSDPRAPGGAVSERAVGFKDSSNLPDKAKVFARARVAGRWSAPLIESR